MKRLFLTIFLLFSFTFAFASAKTGAVAASGLVKNAVVTAEYKGFGELANTTGVKEIENFTSELKKEFSLEWTEANFKSDVKKMLSKSSRNLASLMPIKNIVYSSLKQNRDTVSFSFYAVSEKGEIYRGSCILENGKIAAITLNKTKN